jgi:hypothetical protein
MPKVKISEFDVNPDNNTDINSINIAEGCAPSGINNAIRQLMSDLKAFQTGADGDPFNGAVNGTVGATTPATGAFTTLSASGAFSANGGATLGDASGDALTINSSAVSIPNGLNFDSNTFVIDATNNRVGVGTASPSERLEVSGNLAFSTDATIRRTTSDGADNSYVAVTGGGALSTARGSQVVSFGNEHATDAGKLNLWSGNVANSEVVLNAYSSSSIIKMLTNNAERMRITSTGNVGIGTSSPSAKLDVVYATGNASTILTASANGTRSTAIYSSNSSGGTNCQLYVGAYGFDGIGAIYTFTNHPLTFATNNAAPQLTLNTSGNLGLGVTPSAWRSAEKVLQLPDGVFYTGSNYVAMGQNYYIPTGGGSLYIESDEASDYYQLNGTHVWRTAASGTAGNTITWTQAMTLDASGRLGIGTTSPSAVLHSSTTDDRYPLGVNGTTKGFRVVTSSTDTKIQGVDNTLSASYQPLVLGGSYLAFETNGTAERMRIDSSGNLLVGATAVGNGGKLYVNGSISLGTTTTGAQSSMAKDTTQLTASVSTSATTIYTDISSGMSSASAGHFIIYGNNNAGAGFVDVVIAKASGTPVVVSSSTVEGSPPARTYSVSSFALRLAMASGTFNVNLKATVIGFPF